ncbi:unnamed protein product [Arctogadus glacialis]
MRPKHRTLTRTTGKTWTPDPDHMRPKHRTLTRTTGKTWTPDPDPDHMRPRRRTTAAHQLPCTRTLEAFYTEFQLQ